MRPEAACGAAEALALNEAGQFLAIGRRIAISALGGDSVVIHPQVEFAVTLADGSEFVTHDADEAAGRAIVVGLSHGEPVYLDVLIFDEEGARAYGGEEAVEHYLEDPSASVFERLEISVHYVGRVA
jgi:hypothetical protein